MTTLTIERLGHRGDGVAPGPVYIPRTLPGEVVEGVITDESLARLRIVTPSADRVSAPCPHYKGCGGCSLQHAADAFVANWKIDIVRRGLAAQGLDAPIRRMHTSAPFTRRRATFSGRRTKKGAQVGFHAQQSELIQSVPNCHLIRPALAAALPTLEALVVAGASRKSEMRLTVIETEAGLDVSVEGGKPLDVALSKQVTELASSAGFARISWARETVVTFARPVLNFGNAPVSPPPGAFLQSTADGEAALLASVIEAVGAPIRLVDLFAGCGTFALPLAEIAEVHAIEADRDMLDALDDGWRHASGVKKLTTERRDLFRRPLMLDELSGLGAVVIDPPRAGAEAQMREIAKSGVARVASVSCNPVTFARDSAILTEAGYTMNWIDVVDQFRWSPHVEIAASFTL